MKFIVFLVVFSVSFSLACLNCRRRKTCEDDTWTLINRTLGGWCVKIIPTGGHNMSLAEQACTEVGAVLSSVESDAEMAVELNLMNEQNMTAALLGAELRPECVCTNFTLYDGCFFDSNSTCTLYNAFVWTDNFTVGDSLMSELYPNTTMVYYLQYMILFKDGLYTTDDDLMSYYSNETIGALCGKKAT